MDKPLIALMTLCCAMSCVCAAELYKWVDDSGRTHYSDTPPILGSHALNYQAPADNRISAPAKIDYPKRSNKKRTSKSRRRAKVSCDKYQNRIEKVQKQLRAGYREPRGNKLRAKKRQLNDQLRRCRKGLG